MQGRLPMYRDEHATYQADTCQPLVAAVEAGQVRFGALARGHYPGRPMPRNILSGVRTVGHWDADTDQRWGLQWHRNEGVELHFLETGRIGFGVEGREYMLEPDDLAIMHPWQLHRVGNPNLNRGRLHWLIIDVGVRRPEQSWKWPAWLVLSPGELEQLTNILRHNQVPVWHASTETRRCLQAIAQAVDTDNNGSNGSRLTVRINDLFLSLLDLFRSQKTGPDRSIPGSQPTVRQFLTDLTANPEHAAQEWTLEKMADSCGLGVTQFVRHVRQLTNVPPMHYLNECRLKTAARLLRESPRKQVTDVALECGFSSSQYFATVFSRQFGVSPRAFRRSSISAGD